jgi:hypothetical protein
MKKLLYSAQIVLFIFFVLTFLLAILEMTGPIWIFSKLNSRQTPVSSNEEFDPSLHSLDNITKLGKYCDSIYEQRKISSAITAAEKEYAQIATEVVRKRFYHGLSSFGVGNNYLGYIANPGYFNMYLNAPVSSNDILKFPCGICSQQAIVLMDLLKNRGYKTRKVGFYDKTISGHFCLEAFYNGSWHFFDPDLEPDMSVLNAYNQPGIEFLVAHRDILKKAYRKMDPSRVDKLFPTYFYGKVNETEGKKARIFQQITKSLSYTIWIIFLFAFIWVRRKLVRLSKHTYVRNRRISFPNLQAG